MGIMSAKNDFVQKTKFLQFDKRKVRNQVAHITEGITQIEKCQCMLYLSKNNDVVTIQFCKDLLRILPETQ